MIKERSFVVRYRFADKGTDRVRVWRREVIRRSAAAAVRGSLPGSCRLLWAISWITVSLVMV